MPTTELIVTGDGTRLFVTDLGGEGPPVLLLHGLAGSSRELMRTADALSPQFRVLLLDQRGHGRSTRRPPDLSRAAYVADVVTVIQGVVSNAPVRLVGQSMGAHTAFLTASARPDLVHSLVMLEGHVQGDGRPEASAELGAYFASWPIPFSDVADARSFLGDSSLASAWIEDLELTPEGLLPSFDPDIMQATIAAVHVPQWQAWESLTTPTLVVFADNGMFSAQDKTELILRRPQTLRVDLVLAGHEAHLDAFDSWIGVLRDYLLSS